jgi:FkbM family methyltransferase
MKHAILRGTIGMKLPYEDEDTSGERTHKGVNWLSAWLRIRLLPQSAHKDWNPRRGSLSGFPESSCLRFAQGRYIFNVMRRHLKRFLRRFGYNVSRLPANRFDATADALLLLRSFGYTPRVIVDAGANMGEWTRMVSRIFPSATFHLIEPQPGCLPNLLSVVREIKGQLHAVALTEPGVAAIHIAGDGLGNTGAYICSPTERADTVLVPANTLDNLVTVTQTDRALVKLDLETHELVTLSGAGNLLRACEVVLTEVSFYHPTAPLFLDIANFFAYTRF